MTPSNNQTLISQHSKSPAFDDDIDPIDLLTTIDGFIHELDGSPSPETARRIFERLAQYQIITIEYQGAQRWITSPVTIRKETIKNSLTHRIAYLIKTGGEWKGERAYRDSIEVETCTTVPINIPIDNETKHDIMDQTIGDSSITTLAIALTALHHMFTENLELGGSVGVFEKPYGISNMNRLKSWLESNEDKGPWSMKETLRTYTLNQLVDDAVFTVSK